MAIQQFPNTQLKNYYLFENKIYETQKNLIDKYNLSKKDWQKLLEEKKISQTTDSFIFDGMAQHISVNPDQENVTETQSDTPSGDSSADSTKSLNEVIPDQEIVTETELDTPSGDLSADIDTNTKND